MADLLIELFSEEIPARMQAQAVADLRRLVTDGLVAEGLTYGAAQGFATPRRLTLALADLPAMTMPLREERKGPRTDAPAAALEGFLRTTGLAREVLEVRDEKKGQVWFAVLTRPGRPAEAVIAGVLEGVIRAFPWPKSMRWGAGSLRWVRPLQSILCLLSDEAGARVVPLTVDGFTAGDTTEGHRFMAPGRFSVTSFEDYAAKLSRAHVVLDAQDRAARILADARTLAFARGLEVVEDAGLLAEVAGLVEWPVVLMGDIRADFLDLPPEVLRTSMKEHQKFFSVRNPKTGRIENYITVANCETADNGATILHGNGKVLAARLSDAKFFWENDLREARAGMATWRAGLEAVVFHARLGSQAARIDRIAALAGAIAPIIGADGQLAAQAAGVAKLDLRSAMVGEFPELQGLMGRYYAQAAGLPPEVAAASAEHYAPLGPSDRVPVAPVSVAVALADKIDLLTGFWAIDEKPTGSKDPFALRRAALGVIRLILTNRLRLSVDRLFDAQGLRHLIPAPGDPDLLDCVLASVVSDGVFGARTTALLAGLGDAAPDWSRLLTAHDPAISDDLTGFLHDRLKVHLREEGISHDVIDAVLAMPGYCDLTLVVARAHALAGFVKTEDGANLLAGFKRANNILMAEEKKDGVEYSLDPDPKFAESDVERALFAALDRAEAAIGPALAAEDFAGAMAAMAGLRAPIDGFFEGVVVNSPNGIIRRNRLCLLRRIRTVMEQVAKLGLVEG